MKQHPWRRGNDYPHTDPPPSHKLRLPSIEGNAARPSISSNTQGIKAPSRIDRELAAYYHPKIY
jgi:hypothetical protein